MTLAIVTAPITANAVSNILIRCWSGDNNFFMRDEGEAHVVLCPKHRAVGDMTNCPNFKLQLKAKKDGKWGTNTAVLEKRNLKLRNTDKEYTWKKTSPYNDSYTSYARGIFKDYTCLECYLEGKQEPINKTTSWTKER